MSKETGKPEITKAPEQTITVTDQIELLRETVKHVLRDLSNLADAVKQAEKDKRASEKEVETARAVLKKLQQVTI